MNETLKIVALLGGALILWNIMRKQTAATPADASTTATPTQPATTTAATSTAAPVGTVARLNAYAASSRLPSLMNADQWGWIYAQVRGIEAPDPNIYLGSRPRDYQFTADQWFAEAIMPAGLSGVSRRVWGV